MTPLRGTRPVPESARRVCQRCGIDLSRHARPGRNRLCRDCYDLKRMS
jgi:NMD protein affecting ribosome stability and mRNA decay